MKLATVCAPASSSTVWLGLAVMVKEGASFTAFTVIVNCTCADVLLPPLAVPPSSLSVTVTVDDPLASTSGVKESVPSRGLIWGDWENRPLLVLDTLNVKPSLSPGPAEMFVAQVALYAPESSLTVTLPPLVNVGASLTLVTVMVNWADVEVSTPPLAVPPLSLRVTVTVALPNASLAGV